MCVYTAAFYKLAINWIICKIKIEFALNKPNINPVGIKRVYVVCVRVCVCLNTVVVMYTQSRQYTKPRLYTYRLF